jgi:hypothetical protein
MSAHVAVLANRSAYMLLDCYDKRSRTLVDVSQCWNLL